MDRKDWTTLVIDAAGPQGLSSVQLQKCLFLVGQSLPQADRLSFYQFVPYNYGPFSVSVYGDTEQLESAGLVSVVRSSFNGRATYMITPLGKERAKDIIADANGDTLAYLRTVVAWALPLSFAQIVKAIYVAYPAYQKNSVFQG